MAPVISPSKTNVVVYYMFAFSLGPLSLEEPEALE